MRKKRGFMLPMDDVVYSNRDKVEQYVRDPASISRRILSVTFIKNLFIPSAHPLIAKQKEYMLWRLFLLEVWVKSHESNH